LIALSCKTPSKIQQLTAPDRRALTANLTLAVQAETRIGLLLLIRLK
jgi:hypothetical protein